MILFALRCGRDHHFEAWFRDGATYEAQAAAGEIACPECGDTRVVKAVMAPRLNSARGEQLDVRDAAHQAARAARVALTELREAIETTCDNVGERFPEEARRIHYGEVEAHAIYGSASPEESRALAEEGVEFAVIPWIKADEC
jgi:hypothetical protein